MTHIEEQYEEFKTKHLDKLNPAKFNIPELEKYITVIAKTAFSSGYVAASSKYKNTLMISDAIKFAIKII